MEASKLPDTEIKTMILRIFKEFNENFDKVPNLGHILWDRYSEILS